MVVGGTLISKTVAVTSAELYPQKGAHLCDSAALHYGGNLLNRLTRKGVPVLQSGIVLL